jgi:hypothetical protein
MADFKTSLLVNRQVPEFIREEYPLFITFLEAYYEFLENEQNSQKNDLVKVSKDLRNLPDVDQSIEDFQNSFFNMYASLVPQDVAIDKATLIKNVLPLYLSKGSENSFKLLFRLLFAKELDVTFPKSDVLRASDGKWVEEKFLKISDTITTIYTGDGTTTIFDLIPCRCPITSGALEFTGSVRVNGILVDESEYFVRKDILKLYFYVAPSNGAAIEVFYNNPDKDVLVARKITGRTSNASGLVERIGTQILNNRIVNEIYVSEKTLNGTFSIGEDIFTDYVTSTGSLVTIKLRGVSRVIAVNVLEGGSNYQVGDSVLINAPEAEIKPLAVISKVFSGRVNQVNVLDGGAGFQVAKRISALGFANTELEFAVSTVSGTYANSVANVFYVYSDVISDIDPANTTIDTTDYNFPGNVSPFGVTNANTILQSAFSNATYTLIGGISNVSIITSNVIVSSSPILDAEPATLTISPLTANTLDDTIVSIDTYGSIGKLRIISRGTGYQIGDELVFTNPPNRMAFGVGAEGEVSNTFIGTGSITQVQLLPPKITGTVNVFSLSNTNIQGNNTVFLSELANGDLIVVRTGASGIGAYETRKVINVLDDENITINAAFSNDSFLNNRKIRKVGIYPLGGQGYKQDRLPLITVLSANGTGANIVASTILGDGENLEALGTKRPGEIEEISIIDPGLRITVIPQVDLSQSGDGTALANVTLSPTFDSLPGRWTSSDGILSSDRRLQGRDFYVNYSYLTSSFVEFSKYKKIFRELLHPAGFKAYATLDSFNVITQNTSSLSTLVAPTTIRTLSGLVNVANASIYVTGIGTRFNVANDIGLITIGSFIAVNSEIRVVNSIISNTNLEVTSAFTISANLEEMIVVNTAYDAIATEITLDEITAENELILTVEE